MGSILLTFDGSTSAGGLVNQRCASGDIFLLVVGRNLLVSFVFSSVNVADTRRSKRYSSTATSSVSYLRLLRTKLCVIVPAWSAGGASIACPYAIMRKIT